MLIEGCISKWIVTAPNGDDAPKSWAMPLCTEAPAACTADCLDATYKALPPQGEVSGVPVRLGAGAG